MKYLDNVGILLLSIWLLAVSAVSVFSLPATNMGITMHLLALLAGAFLLFRLRDPKAYINVGMLMVSLWLIFVGGLPIIGISMPGGLLPLAILAIIGGVFLIPSILDYKSFYSLGLFFLSVWLIVGRALPLFALTVPGLAVGLALAAAMASLLMLLGM
jgi:hypothetical protein